MTPKRYNELMDAASMGREEATVLTEEEGNEGWHYCIEWDFLLINPDMPEWNACSCFDDKELAEIEKHRKEHKM